MTLSNWHKEVRPKGLKILALALLLLAATLPAQVKLPPHSRRVLPGGLTVTLSPRTELPLITLHAVVRGGAEADPPAQAGLNHVTAEMLRRGVSGPDALSAAGFAEALDFLGAEFKTKVDSQSTHIVMEFLSKDAARALDLFAAALIRPAFDAAEVAKTIEQQIGAALAAKDEPRTAAQLYFRPFYFGAAHPYGHPASGDELSLKAITRDSIVGTHRRLYVARNVHIVAVGDFDPSAFALRIEKAFASIPSGSRFDWTSASTVSHTQPRLLLVDKPDATQTYFTIALPGIDRKHRDRTVLDLVNTLFGGRFTSLLNDELRVNSGLTYGAGSRVQTDRLPGAIAIASFTKTESTVPAIDLAVEVLGRFHDNGITAAQLQSAKAYVKGTFPPRALETTGQVAELIGELDLFGLSRGEIDDMFSRIDAVTLEQANVAIRRYFVPERLQFCLIGKAAEIAKDVEKYADHRRVIPLASPGVRVPNF